MTRGKPNHKWYDYLLIPIGLVVVVYLNIKTWIKLKRDEATK